MLTVGSLFSGIGMLDYGLHLAGLHHSWFCEADEWRRGILAKRWPGVPVLNDVRVVGADAVSRVGVIAGGFPCKGASIVGKRDGMDNAETVLWREMARAIRELEPRYVLVENVANILALHDGAVWGEVVGDLATLGFDIEWDCFPAAAFGAPHLRDRVIAVASHPDRMAWTAAVGSRGRPGAVDEPGAVERPERSDRDAPAASIAESKRRAAFEPEVQQSGMEAVSRAGGASPAPNASGDGVRQQPVTERRRDGTPLAALAGEAATDLRGERQPQQPISAVTGAIAGLGVQARHDAERRGVRVEWGEYEPAIRRWEAVHGPAPEPLVRRVDDGGALRVERSRLSALGDGVHVYLGRLAGEHILNLERERLREAA